MATIPLTRGQFLLPFVGILRDSGAPVSSTLERFRLPSALEEKSDLYIPLLPAIRFVEAAQKFQGIEDFSFLATQRLQYSHLREKTRALIAHSPTLLVALQHACKWAPREDTILSMWMERDVDHVRICSRLSGVHSLPHLEHAQWLQLIFPIYIVRQFAGAGWMPATIAFEARYTPGRATQALWPNVRFLSGQQASWISVPISHLSLSAHASASIPPPLDTDDGPSGYDIVELIKLLLPAYLDETPPTLAVVAEMAGVSTRSLQRRLHNIGLSYSGILDTVRYENASKLLRSTDAKIIDIAYSSGYTDPAHFSRAFRRISGVTPRQFRDKSRMAQ
jgi:AraC-like DNA-binding protein